MTHYRGEPQIVPLLGGTLPTPAPFDGEYGPLRDEIFDFIDATTDQDCLANGATGQRFEW